MEYLKLTQPGQKYLKLANQLLGCQEKRWVNAPTWDMYVYIYIHIYIWDIHGNVTNVFHQYW
jgi:hypothetical protein